MANGSYLQWLVVQTETHLKRKGDDFNNYARSMGMTQDCPGQTQMMVTLQEGGWFDEETWPMHEDSRLFSRTLFSSLPLPMMTAVVVSAQGAFGSGRTAPGSLPLLHQIILWGLPGPRLCLLDPSLSTQGASFPWLQGFGQRILPCNLFYFIFLRCK